MKNLLYIASALVALTLTAGAADTYEIDSDKSKVTFKIQNKPPGAEASSEVDGKFTDFSGTVTFDDADPSKSSVEMEIKTTSVDTANTKRDDHLRNQDFFKVKEHPKMTFKSKSVKKNAEGNFEVEGDFTLLGESKTITVTFEPNKDKNGGKTTFKFKRGDYGMKFRIPDTADEVDVTLDIVGKKK
jgi:polyisoprenoid-binding protein YceI